jgi:hypothetical protein
VFFFVALFFFFDSLLFSANRIWSQQKDNSRLVFIKRAQIFACNRLYMHALYRHRSALDDKLLDELIELSLSPYTRIRKSVACIPHHIELSYLHVIPYRQAQGIFHNVSGVSLW